MKLIFYKQYDIYIYFWGAVLVIIVIKGYECDQFKYVISPMQYVIPI